MGRFQLQAQILQQDLPLLLQAFHLHQREILEAPVEYLEVVRPLLIAEHEPDELDLPVPGSAEALLG